MKKGLRYQRIEARLGPPQSGPMSLGGGILHAWYPRPHVLVGHLEGRCSVEVSDAMIEAAERACGQDQRPIAVIQDWLDMKSYAVQAQAALTRYVTARLSLFDPMVIAVRMPLVSIGVRTANIALGGRLKIARNHADVIAAIERACA